MVERRLNEGEEDYIKFMLVKIMASCGFSILGKRRSTTLRTQIPACHRRQSPLCKWNLSPHCARDGRGGGGDGDGQLVGEGIAVHVFALTTPLLTVHPIQSAIAPY